MSFAARALTLTRHGGQPYTEWELTSALPSPFGPEQTFPDWLTVTAVRFRSRGSFDPHWMLHGLRSHVRVLSEKHVSAYQFLMLNRNPLHVAMLGPDPVGAWVPLPGTNVKLQTQRSDFPQDPGKPTLSETYPNSDTKPGVEHGQGYPLGDFLLPDLVMWSDDPSAQLLETPFAVRAGSGVTTALLFRRSTFSLQVQAEPLSHLEVEDQLYGAHIAPDPRDPTPIVGNFDGGQINLTLNAPLSQVAYGRLKRRVGHARVQKLHLRSLPGAFDDYLTKGPGPNGSVLGGPGPGNAKPAHVKPPPLPTAFTVTEKAPPLPLYAGFNVWGPLRSVTFSNVRGNASIGSRALSLAGAPNLRLSGVKGLRSTDGGQQLIEAPLATSNQSAKLGFRAVANVSINGASETSWWVEHKTDLAIAALLAAVLSTIASGFAITRALAGAVTSGA